MLDGLDEGTLLDVHGLHTETAFLLLQLVVHDLLKAHTFKAEKCCETLVVAFVAEDVIAIHAGIVSV